MTSTHELKLAKVRKKEAIKAAKQTRRDALEEARSPAEIEEEIAWLAAGGHEPAAALVRAREAAKGPQRPRDDALEELRAAASLQTGSGRGLPPGTTTQTFMDLPKNPNKLKYAETTVPPTPSS